MNDIFNEKRKNIIAITFTAFYTVMLILNIDFHLPFFQNMRYAINSLIIYLVPLITPILALTFMFFKNKEYKFKIWLLPVAFGVSVLVSFVSLFSSFSVIGLLISNIKYIIMLSCLCLMFVSSLFMFAGTLFSFKRINFLKYGALGYAVLYLISCIVDFIAVGGFVYLQSVPDGYSAINIFALVLSFSKILFYIGIFILPTNKRNKDLV